MEQTLNSSTGERHQLQLNQEAAAWLLAIEDDPALEQLTEFRRWLESSADHMRTFLEITAIERELNGVDRERRIDLEQLIGEVREQEPTNVVALPTEPQVQPSRKNQNRTGYHTRIAAAIAITAIASGYFLWAAGDAPRYATELGEQRAVKLDDGSLAHMNTLTRIEIDFTTRTRDVRLLEGEALFTVERDKQRPFRVIAGNAVVQAVGTQFNVYRDTNAITVAVVEGKVKISAQSTPDMLLSAGESARVTADGRISKQAERSVAKVVSWRQRQLTFDRGTLGEAAGQFNRYNRLQIHIADPEVSAREIEGVFNADEPQALLDFLELDKDLQLERNEGSVTVRRKP